jgi:hypothetical protein
MFYADELHLIRTSTLLKASVTFHLSRLATDSSCLTKCQPISSDWIFFVEYQGIGPFLCHSLWQCAPYTKYLFS